MVGLDASPDGVLIVYLLFVALLWVPLAVLHIGF